MSDPSSDLSDLKTAILTFDPAAVRVALNHYDPGTKEKPWHYEVGCVVSVVLCCKCCVVL